MNKTLKILAIFLFIGLITSLSAFAYERILFESTEEIPQNNYYGLWAMIEKDNIYHLKVNSSQSFDLLLLDEENFLKYNETFHGSAQNYTTQALYTNTTSEEFNITRSEDVKLYIIVENAGITAHGVQSTGNITVTIVFTLLITAKAPGYTFAITISGLLIASTLIFMRRKRQKV